MARPTELTFERVAAVADAMSAKGLTPTVDTIRNELGGSDSTISRFLRLWKEQRATSPSTNVVAVLTPELIATVQGWANGLLARAREDHDAALSAARDERTTAEQIAEQRIAELEAMRDMATELEQSLRHRDGQLIAVQAAQNDLQSSLAESEREKAQIAAKLEEARREIAASEQRAALAEQKATMLEQLAPTRTTNKARDRGAPAEAPPQA